MYEIFFWINLLIMLSEQVSMYFSIDEQLLHPDLLGRALSFRAPEL